MTEHDEKKMNKLINVDKINIWMSIASLVTIVLIAFYFWWFKSSIEADINAIKSRQKEIKIETDANAKTISSVQNTLTQLLVNTENIKKTLQELKNK